MKKSTFKSNGASERSGDPAGRDRLLLVAMLIGPTLLAAGWGTLMPNAGPSSAHAGVDPLADLATASSRVRTATDAELSATRFCVGLCSDMAPIESPTMLPALPFDDEEGVIAVDPGAPDAPDVRVASIMRDADGLPAVYADGQLLHEGAALPEGWTIETIDLASRTITISHPDAQQKITLAPGR